MQLPHFTKKTVERCQKHKEDFDLFDIMDLDDDVRNELLQVGGWVGVWVLVWVWVWVCVCDNPHTSLIESLFVRNIVRRSIPIPTHTHTHSSSMAPSARACERWQRRRPP